MDLFKVIPNSIVDLIITDPPYNVGKDFENDNLPDDKYYIWCEQWLKECYRVLKPAGNFLMFGYFYNLSKLYHSFLSKKFDYKETIVWHKKDGGYTNKYELVLRLIKKSENEIKKFGEYIKTKRNIKKLSTLKCRELMGLKIYSGCGNGGFLFFENGTIPDIQAYNKLKTILDLDDRYDNLIFKLNKNITLCELDGNGNVWQEAVNVGKKLHPTQKPIKIIRRFIKLLSQEGDIILDPFLGSGTIAVASQELNRRWVGSEIENKFIPLINLRLNQKNIHHFSNTLLSQSPIGESLINVKISDSAESSTIKGKNPSDSFS